MSNGYDGCVVRCPARCRCAAGSYAGWVAFATVLNASIVVLNR